MTYGYYLRRGSLGGNPKAVEAVKTIVTSPLTDEQKKKFLEKETKSLDNFEVDFATYLATEI